MAITQHVKQFSYLSALHCTRIVLCTARNGVLEEEEPTQRTVGGGEGKEGEANPGQPQVKGVTQTPAAWLDNLWVDIGTSPRESTWERSLGEDKSKEKDKQGSSDGSKVEQKGSLICKLFGLSIWSWVLG